MFPMSTIPSSTHPLNNPWGSLARENVSTFKMVDVDEYDAGKIWFVYGFSVNVVFGELYGPSLWFNCATLNVITGNSSILAPNPIWLDTPRITSPTSNTPEIISISNNFGTQYFVTSTPSKNA